MLEIFFFEDWNKCGIDTWVIFSLFGKVVLKRKDIISPLKTSLLAYISEERCYIYNIFTTNYRWLVVIRLNFKLTLRLLFCPNNNN